MASTKPSQGALSPYMGEAPPHRDFFKLGEHYLNAAKALRPKFGRTFWPTFFVACQALELYLKGFLRANGMTEEELKKRIGHNLNKAFEMAKSKGADDLAGFTKEDEGLISKVGDIYRRRDFQYRYYGEWPLHPSAIDELIALLGTKIQRIVVNGRKNWTQLAIDALKTRPKKT